MPSRAPSASLVTISSPALLGGGLAVLLARRRRRRTCGSCGRRRGSRRRGRRGRSCWRACRGRRGARRSSRRRGRCRARARSPRAQPTVGPSSASAPATSCSSVPRTLNFSGRTTSVGAVGGRGTGQPVGDLEVAILVFRRVELYRCCAHRSPNSQIDWSVNECTGAIRAAASRLACRGRPGEYPPAPTPWPANRPFDHSADPRERPRALAEPSAPPPGDRRDRLRGARARRGRRLGRGRPRLARHGRRRRPSRRPDAAARRAAGSGTRGPVPILMYHGVDAAVDPADRRRAQRPRRHVPVAAALAAQQRLQAVTMHEVERAWSASASCRASRSS